MSSVPVPELNEHPSGKTGSKMQDHLPLGRLLPEHLVGLPRRLAQLEISGTRLVRGGVSNAAEQNRGGDKERRAPVQDFFFPVAADLISAAGGSTTTL